MAETIEKNIETLKADNEKKEQLVDNLAHEMKSPLTSIYGFAEYIINGKIEPEEMAECCSFIMEESMRMKDMCYTLLDLSEIRHKMPEFNFFDAGEFFESMKQVMEMRQSGILTENDVCVEWENGLREGQKIYGNERLMEMLIINLVTNAICACKQKKGEAFLKVTVKINLSGDKVLLCVQDNGIGIPREKLSHVTEPFYRVDKGRSRENGGNGLGLALCRQIVLLHDGKLEIKSEEGHGTEILVIFTV